MNQTTDASREAALQKLQELGAFLLGEASYMGLQFGDSVKYGRTQARFWWRTDLRKILSALATKQPMPLSEDVKAPYGLCPICGFPGYSRERRPDGNDRCMKGHEYPSAMAIVASIKPTSDNTSTRLTEALEVIKKSRECILALSRAATEHPVKQYKNSMYEALCLADKVSQRAERFMNGE